jgi:hypothetical protein
MKSWKGNGNSNSNNKDKGRIQGSLHCAFAKNANAPVEMTTLCQQGKSFYANREKASMPTGKAL